MQCGRYALSHFNFGMFRLDGGAMFGSVPRTLWSGEITPDGDNCIPLATRSLVLRGEGRVVVVDVGMGEKWSERHRSIYAIANTPESHWGVSADEVTDVILTHLHFDHAGGITKYGSAGELLPTFPKAKIHLQRSHWEYAQAPSLKDRASYLTENIAPLRNFDLRLLDGNCEVLPGILAHCVHGHTKGQQWIEVLGDTSSVFVVTDVVPTKHHLPVPYHMGYDLCAETILKEKAALLERAFLGNHVLFFVHDPASPAVTITKNDKGHFTTKSEVTF